MDSSEKQRLAEVHKQVDEALLDVLLKENLFKSGFDICHGPFSPKLYNDLLSKEGLLESGVLCKLPEEIIETYTNKHTNTNSNSNSNNRKTKAYLIGNTKHLWPIFLQWLDNENKKTKENEIKTEEKRLLLLMQQQQQKKDEDEERHGRGYNMPTDDEITKIKCDDNGNDNDKTIVNTTVPVDDDGKEKEKNEPDNDNAHGNAHEILISDPLDTYEQTEIEKVVKEVLLLYSSTRNNHTDNDNGDTDIDIDIDHKNHDTKTKDNNENDNSNNNNLLSSFYYDLYWSSDLHPSRLISMARIASCTGYSYLDNTTHLNIHPLYGTWHSYRAVLLVVHDDNKNATFEQPHQLDFDFVGGATSPLTDKDAYESKLAFEEAIRISSTSIGIGIGNGADKTNREEEVPEQGDCQTDDNTKKDKDSMYDDEYNDVVNRLCLELGEGKYGETDINNNNNNNKNRSLDIGSSDVDVDVDDDAVDTDTDTDAKNNDKINNNENSNTNNNESRNTATATAATTTCNNRKDEIPIAWIKLRDSISIGRNEYKFDHNQLYYHYTKDNHYLKKGIQLLSTTATTGTTAGTTTTTTTTTKL